MEPEATPDTTAGIALGGTAGRSPGASGAPARGVWTLTGGALRLVERWDIGGAVVLVPTEDVLLLAVDLPLATPGARRAALPFAIEDRIADPLDAVHVVLGATLGGSTHLAAVVRHEVIAGWVAALAAAGLGHARLVPDALALPLPPPGSWHVMAGDGNRIIARTDAGTGLAVPAAGFAALWTAAGSPPCAVVGPPVAVDLPLATATDLGPDFARLAAAPPLDLRTGPYAAPARGMPRIVRRAAAVVAFGLAAHTLILAVDAAALTRAAAARRTATEALAHQVLPGMPIGADLDRLLPGGAGRDRLLPTLARAAAAMAPAGGLAWTKLAWSAADARLTLGVEAGDIGGLQRAQAALAGAGLAPVAGAVTAGQGRADGDLTVRAAS